MIAISTSREALRLYRNAQGRRFPCERKASIPETSAIVTNIATKPAGQCANPLYVVSNLPWSARICAPISDRVDLLVR